MEKLEFGETAVLEDGTEYVCFARLEENGEDYVYLVSQEDRNMHRLRIGSSYNFYRDWQEPFLLFQT